MMHAIGTWLHDTTGRQNVRSDSSLPQIKETAKEWRTVAGKEPGGDRTQRYNHNLEMSPTTKAVAVEQLKSNRSAEAQIQMSPGDRNPILTGEGYTV